MGLPVNQIPTNVVIRKTYVAQVDPALADYLNVQKAVTGIYLTPTTARFNSGWAIAPTYLPPNSISNFNFYINGTLVEKIGVVSFVDFSTYSVLTIDPAILSFELESTDSIVSIGKFN
jgi:hypothetical protein